MMAGGERKCGEGCGKDVGNEERCGIISVRAEGGLVRKRETRKAMTKSGVWRGSGSSDTVDVIRSI